MNTELSPSRDGVEHVRVRILPGGRMDRENAANYLGRAPKTLAMWHMEGKLKSTKVGGRCYYFQRDLDAFIRGEGSSQNPTKLEAAIPAKPSPPVRRPVAADAIDDDEAEAADAEPGPADEGARHD